MKLRPSAAAVPRHASIRLSVSSCRTSRRRVAPTERRTAISRSRANPRASMSVARFAHAAISTIAVNALAMAMLSASIGRNRPAGIAASHSCSHAASGPRCRSADAAGLRPSSTAPRLSPGFMRAKNATGLSV